MKTQKIQVPAPCLENWNEMKETSNGKHCSSCNTVVMDFSKMTDTQIQYLLAQSEGKMCGRFRQDQLNRAMVIGQRRNSPDLLAVVLGMTLLLCTYPVQASQELRYDSPISLIALVQDDSINVNAADEQIIMRFKVLDDSTQEPIPFATVIAYGENEAFFAGAQSDFDGIAELKLTPEQYEEVKFLKLRSVETGEETLAWEGFWKADKLNVIELTSNQILLQGDIDLEVLPSGVIGTIVSMPHDDSKANRKLKRHIRKEQRRSKRAND